MPYVNHSFHIIDSEWGYVTIRLRVSAFNAQFILTIMNMSLEAREKHRTHFLILLENPFQSYIIAGSKLELPLELIDDGIFIMIRIVYQLFY
jgi:hypothetical protein